MTRNVPEPDSPLTDDEWTDDIDAAELDEVEDDAERARQRNWSAVVGGVVLVVLVVLTVIGIYNVWANSNEPPPAPGIVRQMPSQPQSP